MDNTPRHRGHMQAANPPTFAPTVWPAEPPAVPPVFVLPAPLVPVEAGFYAWPEVPGGSLPVELPPDFVLREVLDTAEASEREVVEFANKWGPPTGYSGDVFAHFVGDGADAHRQALEDAKAKLGRGDLVSFAAIDVGLRVLRSLARHLLAHLDGADDETIVAAWTEEGHEGVTDVNFAWFQWDYYLNRGLQKFTVHVRTNNPDYPTDALRPSAGLYDACCLQLAHYLASEATVIRCANERCRRPFTRQRGTAKYGHRSRGVRYCSPLCAKAQSERDRRRRRAQEAKTS